MRDAASARVGAIVLARLDSSRLPQKHLKQIQGKPVIEHIVERVQRASELDSFLIATTDREVDKPLAELARKLGVPIFHGSTADVAGRFLGAMESARFDYGVRINGDNLFAVPSMIDRLVRIARDGALDFVSNMAGRTYPYGMTVEIVRRDWYRRMYEQILSDEDREHVTSYLYKQALPEGSFQYVINTEMPEATGCRLAIDTQEDVDRARAILERLGDVEAQYEMRSVVTTYRELESEKARSQRPERA